jgi:hypothetical protein
VKIFRRILAGVVVCVAGGVWAPTALADPPAYASNATSVFVPFSNATSLPITLGPQIRVGFPGNAGSNGETPFSVTMDTGSVGLYMGSDYFTPPANGSSDPSFVGTCTETLTSSGVVFTGALYRSAVNLYAGGNVVATATVPVCAVSAVSCTPTARACNPDASPADVHYFGVGFGQEQAGQPNGTPDKNPFLNITSAGSLSPVPAYGYILTTAQGQPGAVIGLTPGNTQSFALIGLAPYPEYPPSNPASALITSEFQKAQGTITVNGVSSTGIILFDTGVSTGFLTPPLGLAVATGPGPSGAECNGNTPPTCAVAGTSVGVSFSDPPSPANPAPPGIAAFSYVVGSDASPISPFALTVVPRGAPFLNTTLSFLNAFDYLYDGTYGFIGLKALAATSSAAGRRDAAAHHARATPGAMSIQNLHRCFFEWVERNAVTASDADKLTHHSSPYTFRRYGNHGASIGVSTGKSGNPPTFVNHVVHMGPGDPEPRSDGLLSDWLSVAGCR